MSIAIFTFFLILAIVFCCVVSYDTSMKQTSSEIVYTRDNFLLSNWCPLDLDGLHFPTVWHSYYAILQGANDRKSLFTSVSITTAVNYLEMLKVTPTSEQRKFALNQVLMAKFQQEIFKESLLATGNAIIINNETIHDPYWGRYDKTGSEPVSRLIMDIRREVMAQTAARAV
jgi:predicted NAD-dependent protein-ADP-ribosyltransferase YbiA (DUF1768 family)